MDLDLITTIVDGNISLSFAVGTVCSVEADSFEDVVSECLVGLGCVQLSQTVDLGQVGFSCIGQVEVDDLSEL